MPTLQTLDHAQVKGKVVFLRTDLNVPIKDGKVLDSTRIERTLITIRELCKKEAKVVIVSHLGRPDGKVVTNLSLMPVAKKLEKYIHQPIHFVQDCIGPRVTKAIRTLEKGEILFLENVRFYAQEEKNDKAFAKKLAQDIDIYVNDAFATAHRAHASTEGIAHLRPSYAGRLMQEEIEALTQSLEKPKRPVAAIIGGAKISTKINVLKNLMKKVEMLVIGGAMANTFLKAQKYDIGQSLYEKEMVETAQELIKEAKKNKCALVLPVDVVCAQELKEKTKTHITSIKNIPKNEKVFDIGPQTVKIITELLDDCKTVIWNGPLGVFEVSPFDQGTTAIAQKISQQTKNKKIKSVAGGGETIAALEKAKATNLSYISTAGGAFLEWLEGRKLPGITPLIR